MFNLKNKTSALLSKVVLLAVTTLVVPSSAVVLFLDRPMQRFKRRYSLLTTLALVLTTFSFLLTPAVQVSAQTPNTTINFQARILQSTGALVDDGNYNIEFKIYDDISSGTTAQGVCTGNCLWMETRDYNGGSPDNRVRVVNGYVSVNLGSVTAFGSTIPWGQNLYITMRVGDTGTSPTWDTEMTNSGNRMKLSAVPYAFTASNLKTANRTATASDSITIQTGTTTTSGNSGNVAISTGNSAGNSGNITLDVGSASSTAGTITLGSTYSTGLNLGRSGASTVITGNTSSSITFTNFGVTTAGVLLVIPHLP